jgi:hypothetical protein
VAKANGGIEKTQEFYRLFMVPGMAHCYDGIGASNFGGVGQQLPPVRDTAHDLVTALEQWVERGVPPAQFIGTNTHIPTHRQRQSSSRRSAVSGGAALQGHGRS